MTALWVHEIADRFWEHAGETSSTFPRDLLDVVVWAVPVAPVELPGLSIERVNAWLAARDQASPVRIPDRRLRA
jgi:hypothetical protein